MIARTGYLVSIISYVVFLTLDWTRPGFVSNFLSPHIFLLSAIVFAIAWACRVRSASSTPFSFALLPLCLLFAVFAWSEGRAFNDLRILVTLVAFVVPWIVWKQLISQK